MWVLASQAVEKLATVIPKGGVCPRDLLLLFTVMFRALKNKALESVGGGRKIKGSAAQAGLILQALRRG
jgi:hypothetical protein